MGAVPISPKEIGGIGVECFILLFSWNDGPLECMIVSSIWLFHFLFDAHSATEILNLEA